MVDFVLTGRARSGTTVVAGSLITHPEILFYGELFNDLAGVRSNEAARITLGAGWKIANAPTAAVRPCAHEESGRAYLEAFYGLESPAKALGFKLLYDQALDGPNGEAWGYIGEHGGIRIVRIARDNLLDIVCSYARARITRRWHSPDDLPPSPRFVLPLHECEALFRRFDRVPPALEHIGRTHRILDVDYADLSADFAGTMAGVFAFLGVDDQVKTRPHLSKIARLSPKDEIVNYAELREQFQGTPWARHFVY